MVKYVKSGCLAIRLKSFNDGGCLDIDVPMITKDERYTINTALGILERELYVPDVYVTDPSTSKSYFRLRLSEREHEVFAAMFLNNRHALIEYVELFRGTIDGASVYTREVVKEALSRNAAAVIFGHNHPSGISEPSQADRGITERLKTALETLDIRVLDHIIVGGTEVVSFAERGLL